MSPSSETPDGGLVPRRGADGAPVTRNETPKPAHRQKGSPAEPQRRLKTIRTPFRTHPRLFARVSASASPQVAELLDEPCWDRTSDPLLKSGIRDDGEPEE